MKWVNAAEIAHAAQALPKGSPILIVGATDSGKTNCVRQLARTIGIHSGAAVAVVDSDPDQQEVGAPATIGMLLSSPGHWPDSLKDSHPTDCAFVGGVTVASAPLAWLTGAARMVLEAARLGADLILIDTPSISEAGITTQAASALLDLIRPALVVAIGRPAEPNLLPALFDNLAAPPLLVHMAIEPDVQRKSVSTRSSRRAARFHTHFVDAVLHTLAMEQVGVLGTYLRTGLPQPAHVRKFIGDTLGSPCLHAEVLTSGGVHIVLSGPVRREGGTAIIEEHFRTRGITITSAASYSGLLCGLLDPHRKLLDIALIDAIDFAAGNLTITTPLRHLAGVAQVVFGSIRIRPDGKFLGDLPCG